MEDEAVDQDLEILDFSRSLTDAQREKLVAVDTVPSELIESARNAFKACEKEEGSHNLEVPLPEACTIYEHKDFPGETRTPFLVSAPTEFIQQVYDFFLRSSHQKSRSSSSQPFFTGIWQIPTTKPTCTKTTPFRTGLCPLLSTNQIHSSVFPHTPKTNS